MTDVNITVVGNVVADPTLRFTKGGISVGDFTVAHTPQHKVDGVWVDLDTMYYRVNLWRENAEGANETLRKGNQVVVTGKLRQKSYEAKDGSGKRTSLEIEADAVGLSVKAKKGSSQTVAATADPWGSAAAEQFAAPF